MYRRAASSRSLSCPRPGSARRSKGLRRRVGYLPSPHNRDPRSTDLEHAQKPIWRTMCTRNRRTTEAAANVEQEEPHQCADQPSQSSVSSNLCATRFPLSPAAEKRVVQCQGSIFDGLKIVCQTAPAQRGPCSSLQSSTHSSSTRTSPTIVGNGLRRGLALELRGDLLRPMWVRTSLCVVRSSANDISRPCVRQLTDVDQRALLPKRFSLRSMRRCIAATDDMGVAPYGFVVLHLLSI